MLNKKAVFNIVYAVALFGAITSCIGILNELLNLAQVCNKGIDNLIAEYTREKFLIPFRYHLVAFSLCAFTVLVLFLYITNVLKEKHVWIPNVCIIITCVIIFVLSWTLIYKVQYKDSYQEFYHIGSFNYTTLYAFRSMIMSYIASVVTVLFCNIVQSIWKKRDTKHHTDREPQA